MKRGLVDTVGGHGEVQGSQRTGVEIALLLLLHLLFDEVVRSVGRTGSECANWRSRTGVNIRHWRADDDDTSLSRAPLDDVTDVAFEGLSACVIGPLVRLSLIHI